MAGAAVVDARDALSQEQARVAALGRYHVLDTEAETGFDELTELAAHICETPMALIGFLDGERQWLTSRLGLDVRETRRGAAFFDAARGQATPIDVPIVIADALADTRFAAHPLVTGEPYVRSGAGAPLVTDDGYLLGALWVLDTVPREWTAQQLHLLAALARQVMTRLEDRRRNEELAAEMLRHQFAPSKLASKPGGSDGALGHADVMRLVASEERWRALVEHSPLAVAIFGTSDMLFRYANPQAARLYGVDQPADVVGRSYLDVLLPEHREGFARSTVRMTAGARTLGVDARIVGFDGIVRDVEVNAGPVIFDGQPAVQVELRDISARVAAEAALRASEARYRAVFDSAPVGVVEALPDGSLVAVNPKACAMLGYSAEELLGRTLTSLTDMTDLAELAEQTERRAGMVASGEGYTISRVMLCKDGSRLRVLASVGAVKDAAGHTERLVGTVLDVSAQAAADQAVRDTRDELARQKAFMEAVLESVSAGVLACDADGKIVLSNAAQRRVGGPGVGAELSDDSALHQAMAGAELVDLPRRIEVGQGQAYDLLVTARQICDPAGNLLGAVSAFTDITAERETQAQLRESAAFHDAVLAASPDLVFVTDPVNNATLWSSGNLMDLLGYDPQHLRDLGSSVIATLAHPDDLQRVLAANLSARDLPDGKVLQIRYRARHASGDWRWLARRVTPFQRDDAGAVTQLLGIARDITDVVEVEERLRDAALHDPLTGLPNRRLLNDRLNSALTRSGRTRHQMAVLFCDLDGFKQVNDTGGHAAGDAVLKVTADRLRRAMRAEDSIARVGGDEFVIVVEPAYRQGVSGAAAKVDVFADTMTVVERVKAAVRKPIVVDGVSYVVTASIGVTLADAGSEPDDVLRDADLAMYRAKSLGKDRHELFAHTQPH